MIQAVKSFAAKIAARKEQIGTIALGHTVKQGESIFFDQFVYGAVSAYAVHRFGTVYGSLVVFATMAPLSALFCYGYLRLYDWLKKDWFGFEAVKSIQHQFAGNRWIGKFLKLGDTAAFFALSIYADPFMVTVYLRKQSSQFNGLTKRDYAIFWSSVIVSNAYWTLRWTVLVVLALWLWHTVLMPLFAG